MTSPMPNCYRLWLCMPAPSLCVANEEQLLVGVALKAGQPLLLVAQFGQMVLVGGKCLFDAAIVGNVLALGEDAVDAQVGIGHFKGGVLVNDALLQQQEMGIGGTPGWLAFRSTNRSWVLGCHQSFRLPIPSNCAPWSSKPCVISCPITAPMPP